MKLDPRAILASSVTIADRLRATKGRPTGFDYLRAFLAYAVVCWHTIVISYGLFFQNQVWNSSFRPIPAAILPMFFALSGFLVVGSLERSKTVLGFLLLRILRIFPALIAEVTLSALVLGMIMTSEPLSTYLSSPMFHRYFLNLIGDIQYLLPGVFDSNPNAHVVNGQLWTVPFELECYIVLALLWAMRIVRFEIVIIVAVSLAQIAFAGRAFLGGEVIESTVPGRVLVLVFLCGVALYCLRSRLPWNPTLFFVAAITSIVLLFIPRGSYFVAGPIAYVTVYVGLLNPKKPWVLEGRDYSYGIFLYGFPIQQTIAALGPWTHHWYVNLLLSSPLILMFSAASWHFLERPALQLRSYVGKAEGYWMRGKIELAARWRRAVSRPEVKTLRPGGRNLV
jgi:peptidoglycan/LPS O-acetylase OafA/YrhL